MLNLQIGNFKTINNTMQNIATYDFTGKKAIVRVDFNVPLNENFEITENEPATIKDWNELTEQLDELLKIWRTNWTGHGGDTVAGTYIA